MPPPTVPTVAPFTLARASDINAISTALQAFALYVSGSLNSLPLIVGARFITGTGGVSDLFAFPADHVDIPLVFGFTGTLSNGDIVDIDTLTGVSQVGNPAPVGAKIIDQTIGRIGFFDLATMSVPQVLNFNIEMQVPVHTTLQNIPPDAWRRQYNIGIDSNTGIDSRLYTLETNVFRRPPNVVLVGSSNADYTTLAAAVAGIGVPTAPTVILIGPGTYTESPTTINTGSVAVTVLGLGGVQLNYNSASPGIVTSGSGSVALMNIALVNSGGSGVRADTSTQVFLSGVDGLPGINVNTTGQVEINNSHVNGLSGGKSVTVSAAASLRLVLSVLTANAQDVLDLGAASPTVEIGNLTLNHSGVGGLNITASAAVTVKGGPVIYDDTSVGISSNVTFDNSGSALAVPSQSVSVAAVTTTAVVHNLGFKPLVQILDNTGAMVIPQSITHISNLQFVVTWSSAFTGIIIYR